MPVAASFTASIDRTHPALPGHFPGRPVVPGVVLLTEIVAEFKRLSPQWQVAGIKKIKFLKMLLPEQRFSVEFAPQELHTVRFRCWQNARLVAEGKLSLQTLLAPAEHTA